MGHLPELKGVGNLAPMNKYVHIEIEGTRGLRVTYRIPADELFDKDEQIINVRVPIIKRATSVKVHYDGVSYPLPLDTRDFRIPASLDISESDWT